MMWLNTLLCDLFTWLDCREALERQREPKKEARRMAKRAQRAVRLQREIRL